HTRWPRDWSSDVCSSDLFETMGMHVLAGRDFNWFDRNRTTPRKAIVNQAFARRFFPGRNPIGERFGYAGPGGAARADNEIIGVEIGRASCRERVWGARGA